MKSTWCFLTIFGELNLSDFMELNLGDFLENKGFLPKENGSGRAGTREDRLCPSQKEQRVNVQAKHEERLLAL